MDWQPPVAPPPPEPGSVEQSPNGYAIASLALGVLWLLGIGSVLAVAFGYIARQRIAESNGRERGNSMATAGIVLGFIGIAVTAALFVLFMYMLIYSLNNFE